MLMSGAPPAEHVTHPSCISLPILQPGCTPFCAAANLQKFGKEAARQALDRAPRLVAVDTGVWQRALAVLHLHGVAGSAAEALNHVDVLCQDWLAPGSIANRLALQRCMGLSPAGVYQRYAGYVSSADPTKLAGRLLFLELHGLLLLLVADKGAAKRAWRREGGLPANRTAAGEPAFISVGDVANLSAEKFTRLLQQHLPSAAADDFAAFKAGLPDSPAWRQLWAEAQAEAEQLTALLPPEMLPGWIGEDDDSYYARRSIALMIRKNGYQ